MQGSGADSKALRADIMETLAELGGPGVLVGEIGQGRFGVLATGGAASFDDVRVKTNDPAFRTSSGANLIAAEASLSQSPDVIAQSDLDATVEAAIAQWTGAAWGSLVGGTLGTASNAVYGTARSVYAITQDVAGTLAIGGEIGRAHV